jgi:hypothetical protein
MILKSFTVLFLFLLFIGGIMGQKIKPAQFEFGKDVIVQSIIVNRPGGTYKIEDSDIPITGITVEIPEGALNREVKIILGYNDGQLNLRAGKNSGIVFILRTEPGVSFLKPIKIVVPYQVSINPLGVAGYAIDENGRLHLLDTGGMNEADGTVSFYTFKPILLTWVYIME